MARDTYVAWTPGLIAQIRGLRAQGLTNGEIAHAVDWPAGRSLADLVRVAGTRPRTAQGDLAPRGPVYRGTISQRP